MFSRRAFAGYISFILALLNTTPAWAVKLTYAVVGDAGQWTTEAKVVRDSILRSSIRSLVIPGDNLYFFLDSYDGVWSHWYKKGFTFDVVAIGNHHKGYDNEMDFFQMPGEYYSVTPHPSVRFIVLNSDNVKTAEKQAQWLDTELNKAHEEMIFVVYHHPPFRITSLHGWTERKAFHLATRPVIAKHRGKITALLLGHDHTAALMTFGNLPALISGAVKETRAPEIWDDTQEGIPVKTRWVYDRTPTWLRLDIDTNQKETQFAFIRAKDDVAGCKGKLRPVIGNQTSFFLAPICTQTLPK